MGATTLERPSRAILEDRWEGLMLTGYDPTELQEQLDVVLLRIFEGMLRRGKDERDSDRDGKLLDELQATIRDRVLAYAYAEAVTVQ